jgi:hypothetical protein
MRDKLCSTGKWKPSQKTKAIPTSGFIFIPKSGIKKPKQEFRSFVGDEGFEPPTLWV